MAESKHERIIPITLVEDNTDETPSDTEQIIATPMEQLSIKQNIPVVQVKACKRQQNHEDYLRQFDEFEDRSEYTLPNANVQEKIILVIDRAQDENFTSFIVNNSKCTPLSMLKRAICNFIKLKYMINKHTEFAIAVLNENDAKWMLNFTNDMRKLKDVLNRIDECEVEDTFNLNSLFSEIETNITMPEVFKEEIPPNYIVRVVIFYGRSYTIPKLQPDETIQNLLKNPYFICDVLMTHEPVESSNYCNKIFNVLQNIDKKGLAYFFPVGRNSRRLHNCIAKLLGHPLQRPLQKFQKI